LILKYRIRYSNLRDNFIKRNSQQPALVGDLQRYDYDVTSELWSHKSEQIFLCLYSGNAKQM